MTARTKRKIGIAEARMWYVAVVMMAQPKARGRRRYLCETCNVLLSARGAAAAYRKAIAWGTRYESESIYGLKLLGITVLHEIGEEIGDGVDISGRFFQKMDVWSRRREIVPPPEQLQAIRIAQNRNTPLGELLTPHQLQLMRQGARGRAAPSPAADSGRDSGSA
jgi:hypothetical protein